jgi:hypothetical protein
MRGVCVYALGPCSHVIIDHVEGPCLLDRDRVRATVPEASLCLCGGVLVRAAGTWFAWGYFFPRRLLVRVAESLFASWVRVRAAGTLLARQGPFRTAPYCSRGAALVRAAGLCSNGVLVRGGFLFARRVFVRAVGYLFAAETLFALREPCSRCGVLVRAAGSCSSGGVLVRGRDLVRVAGSLFARWGSCWGPSSRGAVLVRGRDLVRVAGSLFALRGPCSSGGVLVRGRDLVRVGVRVRVAGPLFERRSPCSRCGVLVRTAGSLFAAGTLFAWEGEAKPSKMGELAEKNDIFEILAKF